VSRGFRRVSECGRPFSPFSSPSFLHLHSGDSTLFIPCEFWGQTRCLSIPSFPLRCSFVFPCPRLFFKGETNANHFSTLFICCSASHNVMSVPNVGMSPSPVGFAKSSHALSSPSLLPPSSQCIVPLCGCSKISHG